MKKWFTILAMALMAVSASAQEEGVRETEGHMGFKELPFVYKFVQGIDNESEKTLTDLYEGMKGTADKSILKCNRGGWFVKKDYTLPEGNYYESAFYSYGEGIRCVLPGINVYLKGDCQIDGILEYLGDKVTLERSLDFDSSHSLICHMKTSHEVLKTIDDMYDFEQECINRISPATFYLETDFDAYLIRVLSGSAEETVVSGEKIISETNWEGLAYPVIWEFECPWETTDEGLAIHNPSLRDYMWNPQWTYITTERLALDKDGDYIVRLILKAPSDGTYCVGLGNWDEENTWATNQVPVTASDDFQTFDFEFPKFGSDINWNGFATLGTGWVVGTTVVKKCQIIEKMKGSTAAIMTAKTVRKSDDAIYNLAGQKVSASYKGIVIKNGKKMIKK